MKQKKQSTLSKILYKIPGILVVLFIVFGLGFYTPSKTTYTPKTEIYLELQQQIEDLKNLKKTLDEVKTELHNLHDSLV